MNLINRVLLDLIVFCSHRQCSLLLRARLLSLLPRVKMALLSQSGSGLTATRAQMLLSREASILLSTTVKHRTMVRTR